MYSISGYGRMIADKERMDAYIKALRQAIKPGAIVVDIGTGTGIFAMLSCQLGARKVYAIEPSDSINLGKEIAQANGYAEQIEWIQKLSTQVQLPELADVIVSDLRGILPLLGHHLPSLVDARGRMLAPDGILIPQRDTLWVAVAAAPDLYSAIVDVWEQNSYNLDMKAARQLVTNTWGKGRVRPEQFLGEPKCWATLDYTELETADVSGEVTWTIEQSGMAHGLSIWFDATLIEGVGFSNAPGMPELIYGSAFFPWSEEVALNAGDRVSVVLQAKLVGEDYIWRWHTLVLDQGNPKQIKANFGQSTFFATLLSPQQMRQTAASYVPTINLEGQIDRLILALMDEGKPLGEIAAQIAAQFPKRFTHPQAALAHVGKLSNRYSED
jgi:type I protein arginine methyltransferase